jgi:hypothetical protein
MDLWLMITHRHPSQPSVSPEQSLGAISYSDLDQTVKHLACHYSYRQPNGIYWTLECVSSTLENAIVMTAYLKTITQIKTPL